MEIRMKTNKTEKSPIAERVEKLLSQMTLEQKIAQLQGMLLFENAADRTLENSPDGLGAITTLGGASTVAGNADLMDKLQNHPTADVGSWGEAGALPCHGCSPGSEMGSAWRNLWRGSNSVCRNERGFYERLARQRS